MEGPPLNLAMASYHERIRSGRATRNLLEFESKSNDPVQLGFIHLLAPFN
jgi:hypothetical protein